MLALLRKLFPSLGGTLERRPAAPQVSELRRATVRVSRHPGPFELSLHSAARMSPLRAGMGGRLPLAVGVSPAAAGGTTAW